ncbi:uncharacterized protein LOC116107742 [Pistacia vera]|uniref:uncharacterized protein LOC116107742 n=1 Tax=Pistacia vera TaxID=55513 RepID=UPI001263A15C|nr:uncharacterized protein LOC116107742 [Pistacia vera]
MVLTNYGLDNGQYVILCEQYYSIHPPSNLTGYFHVLPLSKITGLTSTSDFRILDASMLCLVMAAAMTSRIASASTISSEESILTLLMISSLNISENLTMEVTTGSAVFLQFWRKTRNDICGFR